MTQSETPLAAPTNAAATAITPTYLQLELPRDTEDDEEPFHLFDATIEEGNTVSANVDPTTALMRRHSFTESINEIQGVADQEVCILSKCTQ